MALPPYDEVQKHRRYPLLTRVTQRSGQTTYWRSENISEGGIFVLASPALAVGTELSIGFTVPGLDGEQRAQVVVVWVNDPNRPDYRPDVPYGMGLRFTAIGDETRNAIAAYVHEGTQQPQCNEQPGGDQESSPIQGEI